MTQQLDNTLHPDPTVVMPGTPHPNTELPVESQHESLFQMEIVEREQLENLVGKRSKDIELQNQKLHMLDMALNSTDAPIAIVDKKGGIVWANTALSTLCQKKEYALIGLSLKDEIIRLDTSNGETNQSILVDSYMNITKRSEKELKIGESIFRLEATRFSTNTKVRSREEETTAKDDRFLMVFKDITAYHEAMMARAMEESLVTLTHELRTPLQGIMGATSLIMHQMIGDLHTNEMIDSLKLVMASSNLLLNLLNNQDNAVGKRRRSFLSTIDLPKNNNNTNKNTFCKEVKEDEASSVFDGSILFVDDILINRKVIGRMLSKIGVSNVVTVESGKEALEELSRHPFDLVITDLQMPEMSGTELTVAINNRISPPIVVGLTADTSFGVAERCKASGMADVLYKPVILSEMSDYLRETFPLLKQGVWLADIFDGKS
mmetsp:Transcript_7135/g.10844  ORF Transcript_7135/g.10844 Transcript_7135/m.10844 type:complete len:435 (+) Transcript_7135:422-1726(+)